MLLDVDFFACHPSAETFFDFRLRGEILTDCDSDVVQRLFARRPLAVAAWKVIAPNGETLFRFYDCHVVGHRPKNAALGEVLKAFLKFNHISRPASPRKLPRLQPRRPESSATIITAGQVLLQSDM